MVSSNCSTDIPVITKVSRAITVPTETNSSTLDDYKPNHSHPFDPASSTTTAQPHYLKHPFRVHKSKSSQIAVSSPPNSNHQHLTNSVDFQIHNPSILTLASFVVSILQVFVVERRRRPNLYQRERWKFVVDKLTQLHKPPSPEYKEDRGKSLL